MRWRLKINWSKFCHWQRLQPPTPKRISEVSTMDASGCWSEYWIKLNIICGNYLTHNLNILNFSQALDAASIPDIVAGGSVRKIIWCTRAIFSSALQCHDDNAIPGTNQWKGKCQYKDIESYNSYHRFLMDFLFKLFPDADSQAIETHGKVIYRQISSCCKDASVTKSKACFCQEVFVVR